MKTLYCLVTGVVMALMMGCTTPKPLTLTRYVVVLPSAPLVADCEMIAPPTVETYVAAHRAEQERMLFEYSELQTTYLGICNQRFGVLRQWLQDQTALHEHPARP